MEQQSPEQLREYLRAFESAVDEDGWEQDPGLYLLEVLDRDQGTFGVTRMPVEIEGKPAQVLRATALKLFSDPATAGVWLADRPNLYGLVLADEGWSTPIDNGLGDRLRKAGGKVADMPDRRETRIVTCVTFFGQAFMVLRHRDEEPVVADHGEARQKVGGDTFRGLRAVLLALAVHMPDGKRYVRMLGQLRLASLRQS